jgi:ribosomal protein RSM22 (predicted rRNA methylase)
VSDTYRGGGGSAAAITQEADALAYAVARMPATYAATAAVFAEVQARSPDFKPASLLDAGCGPGGGGWAALAAWPSLAKVSAVDESATFLDLAASLWASGPKALAAATRHRGDLRRADLPRADLVLASYALAEIPPADLAAVAARLWEACDGLLALVEPGTPAGFQRLAKVRTSLIAAGGRILAPCPHEGACPLAEDPTPGFPGWCHFSIRLPRRRDHRLAKAADAPFEDEPFAYLLAARPGLVGAAAQARVLARPQVAKPGVTLRLCTPAGLELHTVPRRDKAGYAVARRLGWGDNLDRPRLPASSRDR